MSNDPTSNAANNIARAARADPFTDPAAAASVGAGAAHGGGQPFQTVGAAGLTLTLNDIEALAAQMKAAGHNTTTLPAGPPGPFGGGAPLPHAIPASAAKPTAAATAAAGGGLPKFNPFIPQSAGDEGNAAAAQQAAAQQAAAALAQQATATAAAAAAAAASKAAATAPGPLGTPGTPVAYPRGFGGQRYNLPTPGSTPSFWAAEKAQQQQNKQDLAIQTHRLKYHYGDVHPYGVWIMLEGIVSHFSARKLTCEIPAALEVGDFLLHYTGLKTSTLGGDDNADQVVVTNVENIDVGVKKIKYYLQFVPKQLALDPSAASNISKFPTDMIDLITTRMRTAFQDAQLAYRENAPKCLQHLKCSIPDMNNPTCSIGAIITPAQISWFGKKGEDVSEHCRAMTKALYDRAALFLGKDDKGCVRLPARGETELNSYVCTRKFYDSNTGNPQKGTSRNTSSKKGKKSPGSSAPPNDTTTKGPRSVLTLSFSQCATGQSIKRGMLSGFVGADGLYRKFSLFEGGIPMMCIDSGAEDPPAVRKELQDHCLQTSAAFREYVKMIRVPQVHRAIVKQRGTLVQYDGTGWVQLGAAVNRLLPQLLGYHPLNSGFPDFPDIVFFFPKEAAKTLNADAIRAELSNIANLVPAILPPPPSSPFGPAATPLQPASGNTSAISKSGAGMSSLDRIRHTMATQGSLLPAVTAASHSTNFPTLQLKPKTPNDGKQPYYGVWSCFPTSRMPNIGVYQNYSDAKMAAKGKGLGGAQQGFGTHEEACAHVRGFHPWFVPPTAQTIMNSHFSSHGGGAPTPLQGQRLFQSPPPGYAAGRSLPAAPAQPMGWAHPSYRISPTGGSARSPAYSIPMPSWQATDSVFDISQLMPIELLSSEGEDESDGELATNALQRMSESKRNNEARSPMRSQHNGSTSSPQDSIDDNARPASPPRYCSRKISEDSTICFTSKLHYLEIGIRDYSKATPLGKHSQYLRISHPMNGC